MAIESVARRGAVAAYAWSGMVWFSVVYLGQHYVTDVLGGIVFAAGTWLIMTKVHVPRVPSLQSRSALSTPDASRPDIAVPAAQEETAARGPG